MAQQAAALLDALALNCTSPTLAYLLQLPGCMWCETEAGQLLRGLCESLGIQVRTRQGNDFIDAVKQRAEKLEPVHGAFYVVHQLKAKAVELYSKSLRARRRNRPDMPYLHLGGAMPFMFQTLRGKAAGDEALKEHTDSRFVVASTPELGLRLARDILAQGYILDPATHRVIDVMQIYEMRPDFLWLQDEQTESTGNCLGQLILDWEVLLSEVSDRGVSREELEELGRSFGRKFYLQLLRKRHVDRFDVVIVTEKYKCRDLPGGDWKCSFHWLVNVFGSPSRNLHHIIADCMEDCQDLIKKFKSGKAEARAKAFIDSETKEDRILDAWFLGFDFAGTTGRGGYAMPGSRKRQSDRFPALVQQTSYSDGDVHVFPRSLGLLNPTPVQPAPVDGQHDIPALARQSPHDALRVMYLGSCSVLRPHMVPPTPKSLSDSKDRQSRTAARHHAPSVGPPPAGGPGPSSAPPPQPGSFRASLPQSVRDILKPGVDRRSSAGTYLKELMRLCVEGSDPAGWDVAHLESKAGMPCIVKLADETDATLHVHQANGAILAVNKAFPGVLFARCTSTNCYLQGPTNPHVHRLTNPAGALSSWYRATDEGFSAALDNARRKVIKAQKVSKVVKKAAEEIRQRRQDTEDAKKRKRETEAQARVREEIEKAKRVKREFEESKQTRAHKG